MTRDEILAVLRERIVRYAASRLQGTAAEDVAQDVLMVLHEKYPHVTALPDLLPLAFQILRYKMCEAQRRIRRRGEHDCEPIENLPLADPGPDPSAEAERRELVDRLLTALGQLGERCRRLFQWKLEGKSFPEIQVLMNQTSINTIYTWDLRCRKQLLDLMGGAWDVGGTRKA